jgi:hypothetical protein
MGQLHLPANQVKQKPLKLRSAPGISHAQRSSSRNVHPTKTRPNSELTERVASDPVRQKKLFPQCHRTRQNLLPLLHQMRNNVHLLQGIGNSL